MDDYEEAVLLSIASLEWRLARVEYCLGGNKKEAKEGKEAEEKPQTFAERMQQIERSLKELSEKTQLVDEVQELISKHSDVLPQKATEIDAGLTVDEKASVVLRRASSFATVASQLKALDDQQIPSSDGYVKLAKLRPRIAEAEARQLQQALKISELRKRSHMVESRVQLVQMMGAGLCWIEWHKRVVNAKRTARRIEFQRKQSDDDETY